MICLLYINKLKFVLEHQQEIRRVIDFVDLQMCQKAIANLTDRINLYRLNRGEHIVDVYFII